MDLLSSSWSETDVEETPSPRHMTKPPAPMATSKSLHSKQALPLPLAKSTDLSGSTAVMDNFEKYIQKKYMIPESATATYRPPEEQTKTFRSLMANKRKQHNLLADQHHAYTAQSQLFKHLIQRANYIKQLTADINELHEQIMQMRSQINDSTLNTSAPAYRELDRSLTMAEHLYGELYSNHQRATEEHKKLAAEFDKGIAQLSKITRDYGEIEEDNRAKRQKLEPVSAHDLEHHTFSTILEERQRFEQKLQALQQIHEPYLCSICTEQGSTHVLPCCQHLMCGPCISKLMAPTTATFSCPYCRQKDLSLENVIKINF